MSLFPFPQKGKGAPGRRQGAGEAPLTDLARPAARLAKARAPFGERVRRLPGAPRDKPPLA
jgi:hypothetical protein